MIRRMLEASALVITACAFIFSGEPRTQTHIVKDGSTIRVAMAASTLGLIEHRGTIYRFEDLLNPQCRAASADPFVQSFAPPTHFAMPGAGMSPEDNQDRRKFLEHRSHRENTRFTKQLLQSLKSRSVSPWAGTNAPFND